MDAAFLAFDGMTALDFVGAYDPITRLDRMGFRDLDHDVCAPTPGVRTDDLSLGVDRVEPDLGEYDLVFVPGGRATRDLRGDEEFLAWLRGAESADLLASVCTGSLLLGAAGFLDGRRATTHPSATDLLAKYCEVVEERVVEDGRVITGRGVSSSIDLGLAVVERLADAETRDRIAEQMDYPYAPELV